MDMKSVVIRKASRGLLHVKKYSPEILTGLGIVGGVTSAVFGAKATLELEPVLDETKQYVENAKQRFPGGSDNVEYKKEVAYIYTRQTLKIGKLYAPAMSMGIASIGCILAAHGVMRKRNAAIVAGYKVLESAFAEYRDRVSAEVGEDREKELYFNVQEKEVDTKEGKQLVKTSSPFAHSLYAKCFDETNPIWQGNPEYNLMFLRTQQNWANDLLRIRGHVLLNDVYDMLGFPRTTAGAVVGWVEDGDGDGYIDFGIYDINRPMALEFVNGHESAIWLDFNVDGVVYDQI